MSRSLFGLFALLTVSHAARAEDVPDPFVPQEPRAKSVFNPAPGGLRVLTPPAALTRLARLPFLWEAPSAVALSGDFEVSASFDIKTLGGPSTAPAEANVELAVVTRGRDYRPVGINVNANPGEGRCFRVVRFAPHRDGMHWNTAHFPRAADQGRICMRRRGAEVIFLASDGPQGPLAELVRYAADPRLNVSPRLTAFQGQRAEPVPVDVLLTDIKVTADKVLRGPDAAAEPPRSAPLAGYPVTYDYSIAAKLLGDFSAGNDGGRAFRAEPTGVRVKPPTPAVGDANPNTYWFRDSRFALAGDFEITWRCDPVGMAPPGPGGNGMCHVGFAVQSDDRVGSVSVGRAEERGRGSRYFVTRQAPTKRGDTFDTQSVAAGPGPCRITVRRTGPEITILTQEEKEPEPREFVRFPYPPGLDPRVRLIAYQGGPPPAPTDAVLSEFKVRAARVYDPDRPTSASVAPVTNPDGTAADAVVLDGLPPAPRSRKWAYLAWAGGAGLVSGLAGAAVWRRKVQSAKRTAQS